jgi:hypothetical protein
MAVARLLLLLLPLTLLGACADTTCRGACTQFYGANDCNRQSIRVDGTTQQDALAACVDSCNEALYTTFGTSGGTDDRNYNVLETEDDAFAFIQCVAEKDYSEAAFNATCADLDFTCPWFAW